VGRSGVALLFTCLRDVMDGCGTVFSVWMMLAVLLTVVMAVFGIDVVVMSIIFGVFAPAPGTMPLTPTISPHAARRDSEYVVIKRIMSKGQRAIEEITIAYGRLSWSLLWYAIAPLASTMGMDVERH
jgi:hypothetical protein